MSATDSSFDTSIGESCGVIFETRPTGIARITLARPEKHNAFDDDVIQRLTAIFTALGEDKNTRIVVLAGEGKSFSAGADLAWMKRMAAYSYEENLRDARTLAEMMASLARLPQLTIARVQGAAFGGALGLICCCDVALAGNSAKFCLSETKLGLIPAVISPYLIEAIGARAARRFFQTAEVFSAQKAQQLGLLSEVFDDELLVDELEKFIRRALSTAPLAMREAKALVAEVSTRATDESLMDFTSERIAGIRVSPEGQEGLQAFLDKRSPSWLE